MRRYWSMLNGEFSKAIGRAMIACENSERSVLDDFAEVSKIVDAGIISNEEFGFLV